MQTGGQMASLEAHKRKNHVMHDPSDDRIPTRQAGDTATRHHMAE